ncbi:type II toxin-antitoxin system VapC family toxin [Nitrococcus mobilis]|uniref:PIN domain-containing protein n=1 Tax=Nitrococcus mobilis Nb-231 TaxID=314278 RepID=A4BRS2_9GAMM|nr:type II toxin-antitoxin system VapC family toxin [Nitrococcus mobilis]EAR21643.1 hypothetical protein NB231_02713 [Nitrococcus mobilis Nb-231]
MIVYLDTSAFLKLYLEEEGSKATRQLVDAAVAVCTHVITYAEMCAAFAQAVRMQRLTDAEWTHQKDCFEADWNALQVLFIDEPLVRRAGKLAEGFRLRGFDSVHLAAAERVWRQAPDNFQLAAFDVRLVSAACTLGMTGLEQR